MHVTEETHLVSLLSLASSIGNKIYYHVPLNRWPLVFSAGESLDHGKHKSMVIVAPWPNVLSTIYPEHQYPLGENTDNKYCYQRSDKAVKIR